jgi:hypothetical protein
MGVAVIVSARQRSRSRMDSGETREAERSRVEVKEFLPERGMCSFSIRPRSCGKKQAGLAGMRRTPSQIQPGPVIRKSSAYCSLLILTVMIIQNLFSHCSHACAEPMARSLLYCVVNSAESSSPPWPSNSSAAAVCVHCKASLTDALPLRRGRCLIGVTMMSARRTAWRGWARRGTCQRAV